MITDKMNGVKKYHKFKHLTQVIECIYDMKGSSKNYKTKKSWII
jgi:hypothetical protein